MKTDVRASAAKHKGLVVPYAGQSWTKLKSVFFGTENKKGKLSVAYFLFVSLYHSFGVIVLFLYYMITL